MADLAHGNEDGELQESDKHLLALIDKAVDDVLEYISKKSAIIEELYVEPNTLLDKKFWFSSALLAGVSVVLVYRIVQFDEGIARKWLLDLVKRQKKALEMIMPETTIKFAIREKKDYER